MNRVLLSLSITAIFILMVLPFVYFTPNRLVSGEGYKLAEFSPYSTFLWLTLALLSALAVYWKRIGEYCAAIIAGLLSISLLVFCSFMLGEVAQILMVESDLAARVTIGSAFWSLLLILNLILLDSWQHLQRGRVWIVLLIVIMVAILRIYFIQHHFDSLSLFKEYYNHQDRFSLAFYQHISLVLTALIPTLILGLFLGWLVWRYHRLNNLFFGVLNFLQTIPSIALFALLMGPLAWLAVQYPFFKMIGISGIGTAPAVIALILYTLLPLVRNTYVGLDNVPKQTLEVAQAMGMSKRQILQNILIPLSLPTILSGVRIVVVQSIGLTVVAALIGAGGLGVFVWEGLGQYALDLVLLGAIPTIILAVFADLVMQWLIWLSKSIKWGEI